MRNPSTPSDPQAAAREQLGTDLYSAALGFWEGCDCQVDPGLLSGMVHAQVLALASAGLVITAPDGPERLTKDLGAVSDEELIRTAEQSPAMMRRDADELRRIAEKKWAIGSFDESRLRRIADRLDRIAAAGSDPA